MNNEYISILRKNATVYSKEKNGRKSTPGADVTIAMCKHGRSSNQNAGTYRIVIYFKGGTFELIGGDYAEVMRVKNRIYFIPNDAGYCASKSKTEGTRILSLSTRTAFDELKEFVGDYALKYDEMADIYYVEKKIND